MTGVSYTPESYERAYYEGLFQTADVQRGGSIGGAQAVQFFARSKLPIEVLKNIWTVADQPSTNSLDRAKFAVAIRLIQLTQNGQKGQGPTLAVAPGAVLRPVVFEGVSGVSIQMPPPPGQRPPPQQQRQQRQQAPPPQQYPTPNPQRPRVQQQAPPTPRQQQMSAPPTPVSQRATIQQQPPQQMQAPPTPVRQGMPPPTPGQQSRALVSQDPYTMTPQERARYESLFPQYAKPDGFVYGQEAVGLFMKSGIDQNVLRDIWNMVDRPVDNRLDKLEFATAMHLIVCISKKNLPVPEGGLPNSLKALRAAGSAPPTPSVPRPPIQQQPEVAQQAPARIPSPPPMQVAGGMGGMGSISSPTMQRQSFEQPPTQQYGQPPVQPGGMYMRSTASFDQQQPRSPGPPPVVATGGLSISDAFEGLSTTSGEIHSSTLPSYVPEQPTPKPNYAAITPVVPEEPAPTPRAPVMPKVVSPPPSTQALAAGYDMGNAHQELHKLKDVLQKLQAENISLKAQLGSMSEEEKDVQKELGATVAEIGKLSNELHKSRADVLSSKTRLLEASAELKATRDQKDVLHDLIGEARETKSAIDEAQGSIQNASEVAHHMHDHQVIEQQKEQAFRKSNVFEANLFGFESAPASASMEQPPAALQAMASYDTMDNSNPGAAVTNASVASGDFSVQSNQLPARMTVVQTVSSDDEQVAAGASRTDVSAPDLFNNEYNSYSQTLPPPTQMEQPSQPELQPMIYSAPPPQQQAPQRIERPLGIGHISRKSSVGFNSELIMGGSALPLPEPSPGDAMSPAARATSDSSAYGYEDEDEYTNVEELKKKARSASEIASDAGAAHRQLMTEADELRQDADKAEATARSLRAAAAEKKKGGFGAGGKKKKLLRESEKAAGDAEDLRKRFLIVQGQANDAQAVSMATKREADMLREEAEKAELDMAAAASMRDQQRKEQEPPKQQPAPAASNNGYPQQPGPMYGYGQPTAPSQGYDSGQLPAMSEGLGGYGQQPTMPQYGSMAPPASDNGFAVGVMGGGGDKFDLPSPTYFAQTQNAGDNATNPF